MSINVDHVLLKSFLNFHSFLVDETNVEVAKKEFELAQTAVALKRKRVECAEEVNATLKVCVKAAEFEKVRIVQVEDESPAVQEHDFWWNSRIEEGFRPQN